MMPEVGSSRPASSLNSVDLPPPFSPTSPIRSPSIISRSISRKIRLPPKSLLTFEKLTSNIFVLRLSNIDATTCEKKQTNGEVEEARRQQRQCEAQKASKPEKQRNRWRAVETATQ